jgi:hypothetical protein
MIKKLILIVLLICTAKSIYATKLPLSIYKDSLGISYVLYPINEKKQYATLALVVRAGSFHGGQKFRGVAHLVEHLVCNRIQLSPEFPISSTEIAYTQPLGTAYHIYNLPITFLKKAKERFLTIPEIKLTAEEVEKENGVVLSELQYRLSSSDAASKTLLYYVLGTENEIGSFSNSIAQEFIDTYYKPYSNWIFIVGCPEGSAQNVVSEFELIPSDHNLSFEILPFHYAPNESEYVYERLSDSMIRIPINLELAATLHAQIDAVRVLINTFNESLQKKRLSFKWIRTEFIKRSNAPEGIRVEFILSYDSKLHADKVFEEFMCEFKKYLRSLTNDQLAELIHKDYIQYLKEWDGASGLMRSRAIVNDLLMGKSAWEIQDPDLRNREKVLQQVRDFILDSLKK